MLLAVSLLAPASAQPRPDGVESWIRAPRHQRPVRSAQSAIREKLNAWTVGLAGGLLDGAPIRFATEVARVVDDGENLHVLPIVTRGPVENVEALLYLRGVDAAIINADALAQFRTLIPDIQNRITYIINLFPSELQILAGPGIESVADLKGKRVNFNTPGTAAAYSGPLIFDKLKIEVDKLFIPHPVALEKMKTGEISAVVFVTTKPVDLLARGTWEPGYRLLPVSFDAFEDFYLPSTLTSADYPQLIAADKPIDTIAVPTVLAAFNWPKSSERYRRVARLTEHLFSRIGQLQQPGFHPRWKDVNPVATVPGLTRFSAGQEWLDRNAPPAASEPGRGMGTIDPARARGAAPDRKTEQERRGR